MTSADDPCEQPSEKETLPCAFLHKKFNLTCCDLCNHDKIRHKREVRKTSKVYSTNYKVIGPPNKVKYLPLLPFISRRSGFEKIPITLIHPVLTCPQFPQLV